MTYALQNMHSKVTTRLNESKPPQLHAQMI